MTDKEKAFLEDYGKLCLQYGLYVCLFGGGSGDDYLAVNSTVHINLSEYLESIAKESD